MELHPFESRLHPVRRAGARWRISCDFADRGCGGDRSCFRYEHRVGRGRSRCGSVEQYGCGRYRDCPIGSDRIHFGSFIALARPARSGIHDRRLEHRQRSNIRNFSRHSSSARWSDPGFGNRRRLGLFPEWPDRHLHANRSFGGRRRVSADHARHQCSRHGDGKRRDYGHCQRWRRWQPGEQYVVGQVFHHGQPGSHDYLGARRDVCSGQRCELPDYGSKHWRGKDEWGRNSDEPTARRSEAFVGKRKRLDLQHRRSDRHLHSRRRTVCQFELSGDNP